MRGESATHIIRRRAATGPDPIRDRQERARERLVAAFTDRQNELIASLVGADAQPIVTVDYPTHASLRPTVTEALNRAIGHEGRALIVAHGGHPQQPWTDSEWPSAAYDPLTVAGDRDDLHWPEQGTAIIKWQQLIRWTRLDPHSLEQSFTVVVFEGPHFYQGMLEEKERRGIAGVMRETVQLLATKSERLWFL